MNTTERWSIWCRVSGGFTGTREAWLKEDGERWYGTEAEAEAKASELTKSMNGPYSTACFKYIARRVR